MTALNKTDRPMKRFQVRYITSSLIGHTHKIIVEAATAKEAEEQVMDKCQAVKIIAVTDLGRTVEDLVDELETKGKIQVNQHELKALKQMYKEKNLDITITVKKKSGT